jgi:hypothetical protein
MQKTLIAAALAVAFGTLALNAHADSDNLGDIFSTGQVDGNMRAYNFSRVYQLPTKLDQHAFSLAALINAKTGSFHGFSIGGSLVAANSLGTQSDNVASIDASLMGRIHPSTRSAKPTCNTRTTCCCSAAATSISTRHGWGTTIRG